jgi:hypothetical protein
MEYVISSPPKNICLNNDERPKRRLVIVEDFSFMKNYIKLNLKCE